MLGWALLFLAPLLLSACSGERAAPPAGSPALISSYEDGLRRERREKDGAFRSGPNSPLPEAARLRFQGLDYYPPDAALRFEKRLQRHPVAQAMRMATNTGEMRPALRYGWFEFEMGGKASRLHVYRTEEDPSGGGPHLFIPFRDATSGVETYGAGRYMDLRENTTGSYELDFNRAYNPFCAYGGNFSCPFPPRENWLDVPIRAGEKEYIPK